jgi:hypothetical protein
MNTEEGRALKKRMMFVKGDDFYFIAYNAMLLLSELDCTSVNKTFVDHRKLSFLIDFVSDPSLIQMVYRRKHLSTTLSNGDRNELSHAYSRGASRQHLVMRLECVLETKGYFGIEKGTRQSGFDVYLHKEQLPERFLEDELYEVERQNVALIRKTIPKVRTMTLATMLQHLFQENGVEAWHA